MTAARTRSTDTKPIETPKGAAFFMVGAVVLLWILEIIDHTLLFFLDLDRHGIRSWEAEGLVGILVAPLLHVGFEHLASNTLPLLILGFLILIGPGGVRRIAVSTVATVLSSGIFAWVFNVAHTVTVGASGVVFGWLVYLILRGVFARDWKNIAISVGVLMVYGSVLWGVLPTQYGVSWQAHLGGAIGGGLAAWWMHARAKHRHAVHV